jgi:hypothetical protein
VPAVDLVTVATNAAVIVPPAVSVTVGSRVNGRLEEPGVEINANLIVAVRLIVAAKLLMLAKASVLAAVVNGELLKTVIVSGTALNEKSGTPTVTVIVTELLIVPLVPVTVTA